MVDANYNSQASPMSNTIFTGTPGVMYGEAPIRTNCPNCNQIIVTRVEKRTGLVTWIGCGVIAMFGGCLGCCLIPFCIDSLKVGDALL